MEALLKLEEEFKLDKHTLSKYLQWKAAMPAQLSSRKSPMSSAERKAAERQRLATAAAEASQLSEEQRLRDKEDAAKRIQDEYESDPDAFILKAARRVVYVVCPLEHPLEDAVRQVSFGVCLFLFASQIAQVLEEKDKFGNKTWGTLCYRTLLKHSQEVDSKGASYQPKSKGGKPTMINNPEGQDFLNFLKDQFFRSTITTTTTIKTLT
jgi:hypothetical protein